MENPYASPTANPYGSSSLSTDAVSPGTIAELSGTRGWVLFFAVIMWIMVVMMGFGGVGMLFMAAAGMGQFLSQGQPEAIAGVFPIVIGVLYFVVGLFMAYPALKLTKYANRIESLLKTKSVEDLNAALAEQRQYWKFIGIFTILYFVLIVLMVLAAIAIPSFMAFNK